MDRTRERPSHDRADMIDFCAQWDDVLQKAATFEAPLRSQHPDLVEEMEGMAEGAGVDFVSILALNVRSECVLC